MRTRTFAKTIVCNGDGNLLVLRRSASDPHRPGGIDFPGGQIDGNEEIVTGAAREVREEAGIILDPAAMQLVFANVKIGYFTEDEEDINFVWLGFITRLPDGQTVTLSHEHDRFEWLPFETVLANSDSHSITTFLEYLKAHAVAKEVWQP